MNILVINSGSSSIKFSLFASVPDSARLAPGSADPKSLYEGELSGIGNPDPQLTLHRSAEDAPAPESAQASSIPEAVHTVLDAVSEALSQSHLANIDAVGYRVVHPGPKLRDHQRITPEVLAALQAAVTFAPLHDPAALTVIRESMARFPAIPHFACFDTVFHQTLPESASTYPIPLSFRDQGVHRYGFHGLSCESVVLQLRAAVGLAFPQRLIIAHLGSGCSVTALHDGKSVDTSMGLTPTGGVVMGTRPGDLDPGLLFYLLRQPGASVDSVEQMLNHDSGLKALSGSGDMRKLRESAGRDQKANQALEIFIASVRKTIGGFVAVHGMDALVFTGGIGEHDPLTRAQLGSGYAGSTEEPEIEYAANQAQAAGLRKISDEDAPYAIFVVPAEEDLIIALHVTRMCA